MTVLCNNNSEIFFIKKGNFFIYNVLKSPHKTPKRYDAGEKVTLIKLPEKNYLCNETLQPKSISQLLDEIYL